MTETTSSAAPNGEQFPLPTQQDEAAELQRLQALVGRAWIKQLKMFLMNIIILFKGTDLKSVPQIMGTVIPPRRRG